MAKENRGGPRRAGPGKTMGRTSNEDKGMPVGMKKQFILYPADIAILEALLAGSDANGSVLVRGLIRQAERLSAAEVAEVVVMGKE